MGLKEAAKRILDKRAEASKQDKPVINTPTLEFVYLIDTWGKPLSIDKHEVVIDGLGNGRVVKYPELMIAPDNIFVLSMGKKLTIDRFHIANKSESLNEDLKIASDLREDYDHQIEQRRNRNILVGQFNSIQSEQALSKKWSEKWGKK